MASFKEKFPVLQELFAKNHRGPPAGRIRHKEIEVRAGHRNVKLIQTRTESKRSKLSPTRSQPNKMRAEQSLLLSWMFFSSIT